MPNADRVVPKTQVPGFAPSEVQPLASNRASGDRAAAAAGELKAIRERVVALERRLREAPTPEAVAELQCEVEKLTRVLTGLSDAGGPATSHDPWPRDLNAQAANASWGSDPEDLRGG